PQLERRAPRRGLATGGGRCRGVLRGGLNEEPPEGGLRGAERERDEALTLALERRAPRRGLATHDAADVVAVHLPALERRAPRRGLATEQAHRQIESVGRA